MHLAIVGSREFDDYEVFKECVDKYIKSHDKPKLIISGGARGVDTMAEKYAQENNIKTKIYYPNWTLGRKAGILRNSEIIAAATHVIAFPTDSSVGTYDSIMKAKIKGIPCKIIKIKFI